MAVAPCDWLLCFVAGDSRSLTGELSSASSRGLGLQALGLHAGALAVRRGLDGWVWLGGASPVVEHTPILGSILKTWGVVGRCLRLGELDLMFPSLLSMLSGR